MQQAQPTIEMVSSLTKPTTDFLCPLSANTYGLEFNEFKIRDVTTNTVLFEVKKDPLTPTVPPSELRTIKYHFGPMFFKLEALGTTLGLKVGNEPVKNLVMIQRHYFRDQLIKSFRLDIPFCMPNAQSSVEHIYQIPKFSQERQQEMIDHPWQTQADSFYFIEGKMVIHTKALFNYEPLEDQYLF